LKPHKPSAAESRERKAALARKMESSPTKNIDAELLSAAHQILTARGVHPFDTGRIVTDNAEDDIAKGEPHTIESLSMVPPPATTAREMIPRAGRASFDQYLAKRDWDRVMSLVGSHERFPLLEYLWSEVPRCEHLALLTTALAMGDMPSGSHGFLVDALREVTADGKRVFDCKAALKRFAALPKIVTMYRGTVEAELETDDFEFGISWTLSHERAVFFASKHCRFRVCDSTPIILSARVNRDELAGMLTERKEDEVLFIGYLDEYQVERLHVSKIGGALR
jgi:hypothetical protein